MIKIRRALSFPSLGAFIIERRNRRLHTFIISLGLLSHLSAHYATFIPVFRRIVTGVPYIHSYFQLHVLHEAEFMLLILYATLVWRWRGGLIAVAVTAVASIPFVLTPYVFGRGPAPGEVRDLSIQVGVILAMGIFKVFVLEAVARQHEARIAHLTLLRESNVQLESENARLHDLISSLDDVLVQAGQDQAPEDKQRRVGNEIQEVASDDGKGSQVL